VNDVDGYDTGKKWNGWACPVFTREQVERIMWDWPGMSEWDDEATVAVFFHEGEEERFEGVDGLWAVGSKAWCWEVVS
jgi:hypothetical protein